MIKNGYSKLLNDNTKNKRKLTNNNQPDCKRIKPSILRRF